MPLDPTRSLCARDSRYMVDSLARPSPGCFCRPCHFITYTKPGAIVGSKVKIILNTIANKFLQFAKQSDSNSMQLNNSPDVTYY